MLNISRAKIPAWKSSQLSSMLSFSPPVRTLLGGAMLVNSQMDKTAQRADTDVKLQMTGGGRWEFVRAQ